jgi:hypothetical protein
MVMVMVMVVVVAMVTFIAPQASCTQRLLP